MILLCARLTVFRNKMSDVFQPFVIRQLEWDLPNKRWKSHIIGFHLQSRMCWEFNVSSKWCIIFGRRDFFKFLRVIIPEFDQSNAFLLRWSNGHLFFLHKPHHDHTKNLLSLIQGETTFQIIAETLWTSKMAYSIKIKPWKKFLSPSSWAIS